MPDPLELSNRHEQELERAPHLNRGESSTGEREESKGTSTSDRREDPKIEVERKEER